MRYMEVEGEVETFGEPYYRVQARIDLSAVQHNLSVAKSLLAGKTKLMFVIKADGYGHGAVPLAKAAEELGCVDYYGVAIVEEGIELRKAGIDKPILILSAAAREQFPDVVRWDLDSAIYEYEKANQLSREAEKQHKTAKIHVKIDTGMGRVGYLPNKGTISEVMRIAALPNLLLEGLFSHLACADEKDKTSAREQYKLFIEVVDTFRSNGLTFPILHIANSASIIELPEMHLDLVRCGVMSYGLIPSNAVAIHHGSLKPALSLLTHVSYIKTLSKGKGISYGSTFYTEKESRIATIPVGYADGYSRLLSSKGRVLIHGKSARILGRICMDQFMVDITEIENVKIGDMVTLIGKDQQEEITVEELAELTGTIHYEIVCNISKRVQRVYYKS